MLDFEYETKVLKLESWPCKHVLPVLHVSCSLDHAEKFNVELFSLATVVKKKIVLN